MTATLALPPVYAAAVVNGLVGVAVLDAVPCPTCNDEGVVHSHDGIELGPCDCTVAPPVEPGQRLTIAAVGEWPPDSWQSGSWRLLWRHDGLPFLNGPGSMIPLHPGHVVGSAVATTPALPIVEVTQSLPSGRTVAMLRDDDGSGHEVDLSAALPWLPSDLVGRWAVLVEGAATTEQRCPTCWGKSRRCATTIAFTAGCARQYGHHFDVGLGDSPHLTDDEMDGYSDKAVRCATCGHHGTCPPVPLPDGVDPAPYTLTELELTDG